MEKIKNNDEPDLERRKFLKNIAYTGAAATIAGGAIGAYLGQRDTENQPSESHREQFPRDLEDKFEAHLESKKMIWLINVDEIVLCDENNQVLSEPIPFQDFIVDRVKKTSSGANLVTKYRLAPAPKNEKGEYIIANIPGEWLDYVKAIYAKHLSIPAESIQQINVTTDFLKALSEPDEPELVEGIENGEINSNLDILSYFGTKEVRGAEEYNRIEYVSRFVSFTHPSISPLVERELRELLPAICAKESKFNDDLVSPAGARGICQFMPEVWEGLGYGPYGDFEPFTKQVEALSRHIDNICKELHSNGVEHILKNDIRPLFLSQEGYEQHFLLPCIINSYNTGAGRLRSAIGEFCNEPEAIYLNERYGESDNKNLFYDIVNFAEESKVDSLKKYGPASFAYPFHVYAAREVLLESGLLNQEQENSVTIASN